MDTLRHIAAFATKALLAMLLVAGTAPASPAQACCCTDEAAVTSPCSVDCLCDAPAPAEPDFSVVGVSSFQLTVDRVLVLVGYPTQESAPRLKLEQLGLPPPVFLSIPSLCSLPPPAMV